MVTNDLRDWLAQPACAMFPYEPVVAEYQHVGKHFVAEAVRAALADARRAVASATGTPVERARLKSFLDVALDKHDGRYDYPSYLALPLLGLAADGLSPAPFDEALTERDRWLVALLADVLRFELAALRGEAVPLPLMRPDASIVAKRCRLALKAMAAPLARLPIACRVPDDGAPEAAQALCAALAQAAPPVSPHALRTSMLPVYRLHDEYLFLRVLQCFEVNFFLLGAGLQAAIHALDSGQGDRAVRQVQTCNGAMDEAAPLFSLMGTMQVEAFRLFRQYTEGASAIQSRAYKTVETLCRRPDPSRLDSIAFHSVPEVRARVLAGQDTLEDALRRALTGHRVSAEETHRLRAEMAGFEERLLHWRKTHHSLAVRMLGQQSGTGYTEGTPYLKAVLSIPVFSAA